MIYTVTFNPALDYVIRVNELVLNAVNRTDSEEVYYGGKGINVSTVLTNLGIPNVSLGFVAGFTGTEIEDGLKRLGINTDFIRLEKGLSRINVKIKAKDETEINGQGPEINNIALEQLFRKIDAIQDNDILVLAGSIPNTMPPDIYEKIMERLHNRKIRFIVDATQDLLMNVLKYHPFLIKPNHHEIAEIFQRELKTTEEILDCARELQAMGAQNILVSMAGNGAILLTENGEVHSMGVPRGILKNSVGAGDSMVAGFIAGYLKDGDYREALKMGIATGSATAFSDGLAEEKDVLELLRKM